MSVTTGVLFKSLYIQTQWQDLKRQNRQSKQCKTLVLNVIPCMGTTTILTLNPARSSPWIFYIYIYIWRSYIYIYIYMISIYWFLRMILLLALLLGRCFSFASALLLDGKVGGFEQYKLESLKKLGNSLSNCLVFLLLFNISSSPKCKGRFKQWTVKCRCDDPNCLWNCFVVPA